MKPVKDDSVLVVAIFYNIHFISILILENFTVHIVTFRHQALMFSQMTYKLSRGFFIIRKRNSILRYLRCIPFTTVWRFYLSHRYIILIAMYVNMYLLIQNDRLGAMKPFIGKIMHIH